MNTTTEGMKRYFSQFGELKSCEVVIERKTGKLIFLLTLFLGVSKGFGFITCSDASTYKKILAQVHVIDGKKVDCNAAYKKNHDADSHSSFLRRLFVGGLGNAINDGKLYFRFARFFMVCPIGLFF